MKRLRLLLIMILLFAISKTKAQTKPPEKLVPATLPDVEVYDLNGRHTTLGQLAKNKVLFVDCWFIPCPPCFIEMNALHKLYANYNGNKEICFITLCMTDSGDVKKFVVHDKQMEVSVKQYQYFSGLQDFKLPVYFLPGCDSKVHMQQDSVLQHTAPNDRTKCPGGIFSFDGYPTSMIFDKTGKMVFKETGFNGKNDAYQARVEKVVTAALAGK